MNWSDFNNFKTYEYTCQDIQIYVEEYEIATLRILINSFCNNEFANVEPSRVLLTKIGHVITIYVIIQL